MHKYSTYVTATIATYVCKYTHTYKVVQLGVDICVSDQATQMGLVGTNYVYQCCGSIRISGSNGSLFLRVMWVAGSTLKNPD